MKKVVVYLVVFILIAIQFFQPERNLSTTLSANDITNHYTVPEAVNKILTKACLDCHSNNTQYPWYASVQPIGWWINRHIEEGKEHLDFSAFGTYSKKKATHKFEEIAEEVKKGVMPLDSYTLIHKEAMLTDEEIQTLVQWANNSQ